MTMSTLLCRGGPQSLKHFQRWVNPYKAYKLRFALFQIPLLHLLVTLVTFVLFLKGTSAAFFPAFFLPYVCQKGLLASMSVLFSNCYFGSLPLL